MSDEIKRPVQLVLSRTAWDAYDGGEEIHVWTFVDADGNTVSDSEILAALNAQPDAGDVEALARGVSERLLGGDVANLLREARTERDAAAAEATTLRGAVERVKDWLYTSESTQEAIEETEAALATPASPATVRYAAVVAAARLMVEDWRKYAPGDWALADALRALDGDAEPKRKPDVPWDHRGWEPK